jgi:hypothetical protein
VKHHEIYLLAARMVADGTEKFPCTAVHRADPTHLTWNEPDSLTRHFILTMAPGRYGCTRPKPASDAYVSALYTGFKEHSILALCFMAAMVED